MDGTAILKRRKLWQRKFRSAYPGYDYEEFGAECMEYWIRNPNGAKRLFWHCAVDFLRKTRVSDADSGKFRVHFQIETVYNLGGPDNPYDAIIKRQMQEIDNQETRIDLTYREQSSKNRNRYLLEMNSKSVSASEGQRECISVNHQAQYESLKSRWKFK